MMDRKQHEVYEDTRITRVTEMEGRLNRLLSWLENQDGDVTEDVRALGQYLDSSLWLSDFEADEAGEFPESLRRGVLSEDALYNALADYADRMRED